MHGQSSTRGRRLSATLAPHASRVPRSCACAQRLVRELYELATAERVPGVVAHDARSRVFRRCAIVYEQLGEDAFREQGVDDVNPVLESPLDAMARTMAEEALPPAAAAAALPLQASERYADATVRL